MSVAVPETVLVAGSGSIAARHVRNLLDLGVSDVVLVSGRDLSGEPAFGDSRIRTFRALPNNCPPVAIVATDTDRHVEVARELVAAGTHVLIEKPIAPAISPEISLLASDADSKGLVVKVAYNMRFLPAIQRIRALLADGVIGQPLFARIEVGQWLPDWRPDRDYREAYSGSSVRGGGVGLDLSHEIDYMSLLLGMPARWDVARTNTGTLGLECDEIFEGIYTYETGMLCSVHLDYLERVPRRRIRLVGGAGWIECDIAGGRLSVSDGKGSWCDEAPEMFDLPATYTAELAAFFAEIAGQESGLATLTEAIDVLRLLESGEGADSIV
ncbi:MAG: Gfo/Idh/MocA family protein [Coriobacteriia bacterium]